MKEYALTLNLKDDSQVIESYKRYHAEIWPEVEDALHQVGVLDMKIFLLGRRLFMYMTAVESFDMQRDMPRYLTLSPRCQEWEDLMTTFQEAVPEAKQGEKWALMDKVFELK